MGSGTHALIVEGFSRTCPECQIFAHNSPNSTRDCQPNAFTCRAVTSLLGSFLVRVTFVIYHALWLLLLPTGTQCLSPPGTLPKPAPSLSMMAPQRSWGSQLQDCKVRGGKKRAGTDIATPSQKKQKTGPNPRPTLAPELDELNQFVETVAAEEEVKNPDTSFVTGVFFPAGYGIPCNLVFPGGAVRIVVMLTRHGSKIVNPSHSDPLPPWTYGRSIQDSQDGSQTGIRANSLDLLDSSDSLGNENQELRACMRFPFISMSGRRKQADTRPLLPAMTYWLSQL